MGGASLVMTRLHSREREERGGICMVMFHCRISINCTAMGSDQDRSSVTMNNVSPLYIVLSVKGRGGGISNMTFSFLIPTFSDTIQ